MLSLLPTAPYWSGGASLGHEGGFERLSPIRPSVVSVFVSRSAKLRRGMMLTYAVFNVSTTVLGRPVNDGFNLEESTLFHRMPHKKRTQTPDHENPRAVLACLVCASCLYIHAQAHSSDIFLKAIISKHDLDGIGGSGNRDKFYRHSWT
jgi:hypothetical protein